MKFYSLIITFLLLLTTAIGFSQERPTRGDGPTFKAVLFGQVVDATSSEGLEFATISIFSLRDSILLGGGLTGLDGVFEIETKSGKIYAEIEFIGYDKKLINEIVIDKETVQAGKGRIDLGKIMISSSAILADEVTIRAEKSTNQFTLDKRVFNVGKDLANRGGTASDILDNVPSVTVDIEGNVSLRGSTGVRILINGQPSMMTDGAGLKSISSDMIESVEVITNPSSRYEAEGMAGIINIILKKEKRGGFNGALNSFVSYPLGAGIGANLNYRKNKINWFASYNVSYNASPGYGLLNQRIDADDVLLSVQERDMLRTGIFNRARGGIEYFFTEKQSLTGSIQYGNGDQLNITDLVYRDYVGDFNNLTSVINRTDDEIEKENGLQYNVDYRHEFKSREHTLTASFQYEDEIETESSSYEELASNSTRVFQQRSENAEGQKNYIIKADYQQPLGSKDHKYELGLRSSFRFIDNDFQVDSLTIDDMWESLAGFTNDFDYNETIHAAYGQYGNKYGKFGFQIGLRAEYAIIKTVLVNDNISNERDSLNLFPSLFINYEIDKGNAMQISYSRRIRRPRFRDLNPFFSYTDPRNFYSGNPLVRPEYTNSYEANYLKYWDNGTLSSGVFYRHTNDVISWVRRISGTNTFVTRPENLGVRDDFGVEVNGSYTGVKWLRLNGNVNFFRSITASQSDDFNLDADTYVLDSRISSRFTFWESDLQVSTNYRSPRKTPQGNRKSMTSIDLGWSKDFLPKKNLTMTIAVRDLLNNRKRRYETFGENFYASGEFQWRMRTITLSANYRINQKKQRERGGRDGDGGGGDEF